jgi:hypothetical protein
VQINTRAFRSTISVMRRLAAVLHCVHWFTRSHQTFSSSITCNPELYVSFFFITITVVVYSLVIYKQKGTNKFEIGIENCSKTLQLAETARM